MQVIIKKSVKKIIILTVPFLLMSHYNSFMTLETICWSRMKAAPNFYKKRLGSLKLIVSGRYGKKIIKSFCFLSVFQISLAFVFVGILFFEVPSGRAITSSEENGLRFSLRVIAVQVTRSSHQGLELLNKFIRFLISGEIEIRQATYHVSIETILLIFRLKFSKFWETLCMISKLLQNQ